MSTKVELTVTGMKCGGCEKTIKDTLTGKDGVVSVVASHTDDQVIIEFDEAVVDEDDLIELIEGVGFTVED